MVNAPDKNLWVAASDGDMDRVKALISAGATPNDKDAHSYTPMHAAASYAHLPLLEYLVSMGGNVNITDDDGETPLFTCETVPAAQWLVEHGADAAHRNEEGVSAAESLADEFPEVAAYLRSVTGVPEPEEAAAGADVSQMAVDNFASAQTSALMEEARVIMEQAERDGVDPTERLRPIVQRAVREGFAFGGDLSGAGEQAQPEPESEAKRAREE